ncbi:MAG: DUF5676 family membrane protein [Patescibacteria group bacterium]
MINTKHLLKTTSIWISAIYSICYTGAAIYPPIRIMFMKYVMHAQVSLTSGYFGAGYFISGLIVWNIIALLGVWLFAFLFNKIK